MRRRQFLTRLSATPLTLPTLVCGATAISAQVPSDAAAAARLWPSLDTLYDQLARWQRDRAPWVRLETVGTSAQNRPLQALTLTDPATDAEQKEQVLVTAVHSGVERTGATTIMHLVDWLLSGTPAAGEMLKRQVITCLPVVNPDGYVAGTVANSQGYDPYTAWTLAGPRDPEKNAEAVAVQQLFDRLQPEVHADVHGLDLSFPGYIMVESTGSAWSNVALRPYHQRVIRLMNDAALADGFATVVPEDDAERLYWGPALEAAAAKLWYGRARPYAALYAYHHYHTLTLASEVCWERSGLVRHQRLLEIGNEVWPGEYYAGYPTRVIAGTEFHRVVAYGTSAAARRRSRVELWNRLGQIRIGFANPQAEGLLVCAVTTSSAAARRLGDGRLKDLADSLSGLPYVDAEAVRRVLVAHPDGPGLWGPHAHLYMEGGDAATTATAPPTQAPAPAPIQHGLAIRLRVPYPQAQPTDLRLNGHPLPPSNTEGYQQWSSAGFTHLQVNIRPSLAQSQDCFLITCAYDPRAQRPRGWP